MIWTTAIGQRLDMTNNLTAFRFDKEVNMLWYFTGNMPYGYETVEETIFNFNGTCLWIDFQWKFFCFHLKCNFFSRFGIRPRSIFVNMIASWSNSCSEWMSHNDSSVLSLFHLWNTKKICLSSNSQNLNSRIRTEFKSLFECCCCC